MKVTITDVTRMRGSNVCVAGIAGSRTVRLNQPGPDEATLLAVGDLKPGDVVDVAWASASPANAPHVEDGVWNRSRLTKVGRLDWEEFVGWLREQSLRSVSQAFGEVFLRGRGGNCAFRPGIGRRSLATIEVRNVSVYLDFDKVRVEFTDAEDTWRKVALEDRIVHAHRAACSSCKRSFERQLGLGFNCSSAVLRVGLSRPFSIPDHPLACWLQVNGIYPLGRERRHFV